MASGLNTYQAGWSRGSDHGDGFWHGGASWSGEKFEIRNVNFETLKWLFGWRFESRLGEAGYGRKKSPAQGGMFPWRALGIPGFVGEAGGSADTWSIVAS